MVLLTRFLLSSKKKGKTFIDSVRVFVAGGAGGQGQPKFGGFGGNGGNVFVVGEEEATFKNLLSENPEKRYVAQHGKHSHKHKLLGQPGKDRFIPVPLGVQVVNDAGRILGEVNKEGDKVLVAKGGPGGRLENNFIGTKGHKMSVRLDLKLIADVGLVGFPNAGKSTLLAAISRANPKIASYPFTTIQPQIGMMMFRDQRQITVADLPGLIEGAHMNVGLGHYFLKHVERTKLLLFMIDVQGFRLKHDQPLRTATENILLLNKELELYRPDLVTKPAVLVLNKIDVEGADVKLEQTISEWQKFSQNKDEIPEEHRPDQLMVFDDIIPISAKHKTDTDKLMHRIREVMDHNADIEFAKLHSNADAREEVLALQTEHHGSRPV